MYLFTQVRIHLQLYIQVQTEKSKTSKRSKVTTDGVYSVFYRWILSLVTPHHFAVFTQFMTLRFTDPCQGETTVEIRNLCEMRKMIRN